jgi:hypothetical protein
LDPGVLYLLENGCDQTVAEAIALCLRGLKHRGGIAFELSNEVAIAKEGRLTSPIFPEKPRKLDKIH